MDANREQRLAEAELEFRRWAKLMPGCPNVSRVALELIQELRTADRHITELQTALDEANRQNAEHAKFFNQLLDIAGIKASTKQPNDEWMIPLEDHVSSATEYKARATKAEAAILRASHDDSCDTIKGPLLDGFARKDNYACNCWKTEALKGIK